MPVGVDNSQNILFCHSDDLIRFHDLQMCNGVAQVRIRMRTGCGGIMSIFIGTQNLFDLICNALMESKQERSPIGFMYV